MVVLYVILAVLVLLIAVVLLRTAAFRPKAEAFRTYAPVEFDREAAVTNLQQLIRCRTVSYTDASKEDPAEFEKLIALLPELYPHVYENAPSPACRTAACCSTGRARPTMRLRS